MGSSRANKKQSRNAKCTPRKKQRKKEMKSRQTVNLHVCPRRSNAHVVPYRFHSDTAFRESLHSDQGGWKHFIGMLKKVQHFRSVYPTEPRLLHPCVSTARCVRAADTESNNHLRVFLPRQKCTSSAASPSELIPCPSLPRRSILERTTATRVHRPYFIRSRVTRDLKYFDCNHRCASRHACKRPEVLFRYQIVCNE